MSLTYPIVFIALTLAILTFVAASPVYFNRPDETDEDE